MYRKNSTLSPKRCVLTGLLMAGLIPFQASGWYSHGIFAGEGSFTIIGSSTYNLTIPGGGQGLYAKSIRETGVDFSQTFPSGMPAGHLDYQVFPSPINGTSTKFVDFKHYHVSGTGKCMEYQMSLYPSSADWIFWANTGTQSAPNWVKLSDDANVLAPVARVWIQGSVSDLTTRLRLATYGASSNASASKLYIADLGSISQATCEAANISVLRLIGSTVSYRFNR